MLGILLFVIFSIFLAKSFYKASLVILLWQVVFINVTVGGHYRLYDFLGLVALVLLFFKILTKEINFRSFPCYKSYSILVLSFMIAGAGMQIKLGYVASSISMLVFPFIAWIAKDKIGKFSNFILVNIALFSIILLSVGLLELYLSFNPIGSWLESHGYMRFQDVRDDYMRFDMYRCRSLTSWCSTYGVTCSFIFITLLLGINYGVFKNKSSVIFAVLLCIPAFIGVISSGTRSVYLAFTISMLSVFFLYLFRIKYLVLSIIVVLTIYSLNQDLAGEIIDSFIYHEDAGGSSVDIRKMQFDAAYYFYAKNPILGNGIGFIHQAKEASSNLLGAESCIFTIMIDRGIFGMIAYLYFNLELFLFLWRNPNYRILVFIPLGILVGKMVSLFPGIEEPYPILWLAILTKFIAEKAQLKENQINCIKDKID